MIYEKDFWGRKLKIETNVLASQALSSALVSFGDTMVLGTVAMSNNEVETDFFPLSVDYEERYYASGKIKGSRFVRREGRPSEEAVLLSRMVDRAIRPYFPKNFKREVQIVLTVLAFDGENDPDFPALIAASTALLISEIPWQGPVAGIRIAKRGKENFLFLPTYNQREKALLDFFISGIKDVNGEILFNMIDGNADEVEEEVVIEAFLNSKEKIKQLIEFQEEIYKKEKVEKIKLDLDFGDYQNFYKEYKEKIKENLLLFTKKGEKVKKEFGNFQQKVLEESEMGSYLLNCFIEKVIHDMALYDNLRCDGRKMNEIREIKTAVGILPRAHGSGLFSRGLTCILSTLTLGAPGDELLIEGMETEGKKRFLHHYNFPPFSVGEVGRIGYPSRREIGHGALAEKAIRPLLPSKEDFPYTIRIVSEALSSNGSTSMASVCASSLALFDAGVKIKRPAAGISCGLMIEEELEEILGAKENLKPIKDRSYKILTDIQGPEDAFGDMDFKVAGTEKGITAVQMDIKIRGLTEEILKESFQRAKEARKLILEEMLKTIPVPREKLSPYAPCILTIKIPPDKIREVIGPGGKVINAIIEETETAIDFEEDGMVFVTADSEEKAKKAVEWIKNITREFKVGERFKGKITRILDFGLVIELIPNQEGLLHISAIPKKFKLKPLEKTFRLGQIIPVEIKEITKEGKIRLGMVFKKLSF